MEIDRSLENLHKIQSNIERGNVFLDSYPIQVHFLMIDKCNVKCIMCGGDYFRSKSGRMITLDKFKTMAANLKLENVRAVVLAGAGDPMLNRDLIAIVRFINTTYPQIAISITTNGLGLTESLARALMDCTVSQVNISINSATQQTYKRIMQIDGFTAVCRNARTFAELIKQSGKPVSLQFSAAINRLNIEELPRLVELAHETGADSINLFYTRFYPERIRDLNIENPTDRLKNEDSLFYHQQLSDDMVVKAKTLAQRYGIRMTHEPLFQEHAAPNACTWAMSQLMVGFDGEIYPCGGSEVHFREKVEKGIYDFGNALTGPVDTFWNGDAYRALRLSARQGDTCLVSECKCCANVISPNDMRSHIMQWDNENAEEIQKQPIATLPLVSVIVPTYNRPDQLVLAVKSILAQTYRNVEIVVVNDNGADVANQLAPLNTSNNITYIRHKKNSGLAAARNTGIRASRGRYIAYLDDDDLFYPDHLDTLVRFLEAGNHKVAYTDAYRAHQVKQNGAYVVVNRDVPYSFDFDYERILETNFVPVLCFVHARSCIDTVGFFDESLKRLEDWDLWIRMSRKYRFEHIRKITCEFSWREDGSSMSSARDQEFAVARTYIADKYGLARPATPALPRFAEKAVPSLVSIVILTYNQLRYTKECMESIRKHTPEPHEIIVVDNASTDGTVAWLKKFIRENRNCRLIENRQNLGFPKGCNQGIEASRGEFLVLLNNDVVVTRDWLAGMLEIVQRDPEAGFVGPMTNNIIGRQKISAIGYDSATGLTDYAAQFRSSNRHRRIESARVVGFCMLFRRTLAERIGLLDERFGTGNFEDDDLCLRAELAGFRNFIAGDVFVHHYGSKSFTGNKIDADSLWKGNLSVFAAKWDLDPRTPLGRSLAAVTARHKAIESFNRGNLDAAIQDIVEGIKQEPGNNFFYWQLADMLNQSGLYKDALETLAGLPPDAHDYTQTLERLAHAKSGLGAAEEAEVLVDRILARAPGSAPALNLKGTLAYQRGDKDAADALFIRAMEADPSSGEPATNLGVMKFAAGAQEDGLRLLERGFILSPALPDCAARYHAAIISLGRLNQAVRVFRDAQILYPSCKQITLLLTDLLIRQESYADALREIEGAIIRFGSDDGLLAAAAEIRGKLGPLAITTKKNNGVSEGDGAEPFESCFRENTPSARIDGQQDVASPTAGTIDTTAPTEGLTRSDQVMSGLVSIIILAFNQLKHTKLCLQSIEQHTAQPYELILVDNGSTDGTLDYLRTYANGRTNVRVIANKENLGFAAGNNQGLAVANGTHVLLLNNDTVVTEGWLTRMVSVFERFVDVGIVGPVSNNISGPQKVPGAIYQSLKDMPLYAKQWSSEHRGQSFEVQRVVGFCLLAKREVIDRIGGLDETFGSGNFEDDDFCLRAAAAGFKARIAQDAFIHHTGSQTFKGAGIDYRQSLLRNWEIFKTKWKLPQDLPYGANYTLTLDTGDLSHYFIPLAKHAGKTPQPRTLGLVSIVLRLASDLETGKKCLLAIQQHTPEPHEVIFMVPRSLPAALKWVKKLAREHQNYTLIEYAEAPGFSREVNQGIYASSGEYILLLDGEVRVTGGWLTGMLECLHTSSAPGVIGPVTDAILNPRDLGSREPRPGAGLDEYAAAFRIRNRHRRIDQRKIAGICMLFRYDLAQKIGFFDEDLRSGMFSDEDFCIRADLDGYHNVIAGDVLVHYPVSGDYYRDRYNSKKVFDTKWRAISMASELGRKIVTLNTIETAAVWYHQKQQLDKAIAWLAEGVKYAPDDPRSYQSLALMLIDAKLFKDALDALSSMPESARQEASSLALFGTCFEGLNRDDEANAYAERLLAMDPSSAPALNLKGLLAYKHEDRSAADRFFRRASESDPGYGEPFTNLGVMQWSENKKEEALDLLERGFLLSPTITDSVTLYHNAITSLALFARAEPFFRDAKALHPRNKRVFFLYIDILLQKGKYHDAMREIEEALLVFDIDDGIMPAALQIREKIGAQLLPTPPVKRGTLSLCMIVKNEEAHLAKCLTSVKDIADEMIVVDTGSTDKTKDIATAFGAQVFDFTWTADFSEARNFSLSKASGDWILVLDGDEVLSPADHAELAVIVHSKPDKPLAYSLATRNYTNLVSAQGWTANDGRYSREEAGTGWHPSIKVRLFTNDKRIQFRNAVHEGVEPSLLAAGISNKPCRIPVHHYGKMNAEKTASKGEDYYLLGRKKLEQTGGDAKAIHELAVQASELGRHSEAVELWQKLIDMQPGNAFAYFNMGYSHLMLRQYEKTLRASWKALELNPDLKEAVLNYASSELVIGSIDKAIASLNNVLQRVQDYPPALGLLAASLSMKGDLEKALGLFKKLDKMGFDCVAYLYDLADMLFSEGKYNEAIRLLEASIASNNAHKETQNLLARCREMTRNHAHERTEKQVLQ